MHPVRTLIFTLPLLMALAQPAQASVLYYSNYDAARSSTILFNVEVSPGNLQEQLHTVGVMSIEVDGGPTLAAFCADLFTGIASSNTYTTAVQSASGSPYTRIAWLMANVLPSIIAGSGTAQQQGAALQLAIWDIIHDNGNGLQAGVIQQSGNTDGAVAAYANAYIGAAWAPTLGLNIYHNTFPNTTFAAQDLVSYSSTVPEPATLSLSALALGALFLLGRVQRK